MKDSSINALQLHCSSENIIFRNTFIILEFLLVILFSQYINCSTVKGAWLSNNNVSLCGIMQTEQIPVFQYNILSEVSYNIEI